jgi:succinate dehydrogenase / fumarate reductase cytochrome b subunit
MAHGMKNRPLSPHLQVYRLPLTALLSISHRITGVLLAMGLPLMAGWLLAASSANPEGFAMIQNGLGSLPGQLMLWAWIYALIFHGCHGIRHIIWDLGHGLDRNRLMLHNLIELVASVALTGLLFVATHGAADWPVPAAS